MKLNELIENAPEIEIEQLSSDSRIPMKNAIFFCLNGIKYDGHKFINEAISNGAKVIIHSKDVKKDLEAIYIKVNNVNDTLLRIAKIYYAESNDSINKYLVSGCYGRSSVSSLISYYLNKKEKCGSIGIFGIKYNDRVLSLTFPALTALENLMYLKRMKEKNINNCVFETSAISLYYRKFDVIKPDVFIYTNTSKNCSDYLVCNNQYFNYYQRYLYTLEDSTCVVLNRDDESYNVFKDCISNYVTYGINSESDYVIKNAYIKSCGIEFDLEYKENKYHINSKLLGEANVYNLTAAIVALHVRGYELEDIINTLKDSPYIEGVMERVDEKYNVIVDCAYEIDSIENIFKFARNTSSGKVIGVLGINYSDDENRIESIMDLCNKYLDKIILTEDESLDAEVMTILKKTDNYIDPNKTIKISFRSIAIENALEIMNSNDTLLIIGKGNEKYMLMSLGKDRYAGDAHYALKYIKNKENEYEII